MKSPLISIVIPSYNKGKYIKQTLDSIFYQSYQNFEVIVMDGGSKDSTLSILKGFSNRYKDKISWQSIKDDGQLDAINKGLEKAKGEIITFINADDVYTKNAFQIVVASFIENPGINWFVGKAFVIDEKNKEIATHVTLYKNFLLSLNLYIVLLITNYLMQPSVFISKNAYKKYGPFVGTQNFVMEYGMWLKLGKMKMPYVIGDYLSKFRIDSETKTKKMFRDILKEDQLIVKKYTRNPIILFLHYLHNFARILLVKTL